MVVKMIAKYKVSACWKLLTWVRERMIKDVAITCGLYRC